MPKPVAPLALTLQSAPAAPASGRLSVYANTTYGQVQTKTAGGVVRNLAFEYVYNVRDYGATGNGSTDDAAAIQAALDLGSVTNPGSIVVVPPGTYLVNSELEIKGPIWVQMAPGATIKRGSSSMQYMIRNFNSSYAPTLYGGRGNIRITGGVIDADGGNLTGSCTSLIFAHAKNITVDGVTFRNVRDWHALELNSTKDGTVRDCIFEGFTPVAAGRQISEAVQIDLAISAGALPGIGAGALDNTPCDNILVTGCTVRSYGSLGSFGRLVGSHSFTDNVFHRKIKISDNHAEALNDYMVRGYNWLDATVTGNTCTDSNGGIRFEVPSGATVESESIVVTGNTFRNMWVVNSGASIVNAVISIAGLTSPSVPIREAALTGNIIKTYANPTGIEVINTADATLTGGTVKNGTDSAAVGIDMAGSANAIIDGVKVDTMVTGIKVRDATVAGAGVTIAAVSVAGCSGAGIQVDASGTAIQSGRVRSSGSASKASVEINAARCMVDDLYIWKSSGSGSNALTITANSTDAQVALIYGRGWSSTQAANITDNGTTSTISTTAKFIATN